MSKTMVALDFSTRKEVYEFLLKFQELTYLKLSPRFLIPRRILIGKILVVA